MVELKDGDAVPRMLFAFDHETSARRIADDCERVLRCLEAVRAGTVRITPGPVGDMWLDGVGREAVRLNLLTRGEACRLGLMKSESEPRYEGPDYEALILARQEASGMFD